jgi:hypothetical protein
MAAVLVMARPRRLTRTELAARQTDAAGSERPAAFLSSQTAIMRTSIPDLKMCWVGMKLVSWMIGFYHEVMNSRKMLRSICAAVALSFLAGSLWADDAAKGDLTPLILKLPAGSQIDGPPKDAPPLMIPKDAKNIAHTAKVTTSDGNCKADALAKITDGNKESADDNIALLRKGVQYVQFDFGAPQEFFAVAVWHAFDTMKVYHAVVVQVADDADFTKNVQTLFNNDAANLAGRGAGTDHEYFETNFGKLIDAKGAKGQFVRLYSKGSTDGSFNEYTEVEIYGRPVK